MTSVLLVEAELLERLEDLARRPVQLLDHVAVAARWRSCRETPRPAIQRQVHGSVRQVEEEGPVLVGVDELDGLVRVALRRAVLVDRGLDDRLVRASAAAAGVLRLPVAHVVAVGDAEVVVEALPRGQELRLVAEVPLADARRGVAPGLEQLGDGDLLGVEALAAAREEHEAAILVPCMLTRRG